MTQPNRKEKELTGRHVLFMVMAFFGVIIGVNVIFTIAAVNSFTGEDVKGSYRQGLEYNKRLDQRSSEQGLGWTVKGNVVQDKEMRLIFAVYDQSGQPLRDLNIEGTLRHPTDRAFDRPLMFEINENGNYRAVIDAQPAQWRFLGRATDTENVFRFEYNVTLE